MDFGMVVYHWFYAPDILERRPGADHLAILSWRGSVRAYQENQIISQAKARSHPGF